MGAPSEADNLLRAVKAQTARIHTSIPGVVVSYDAATQTADVRPAVKSFSRDAKGAITAATQPVIPAVPVAFPEGGGFSITWPLEAGDPVLLVFCERSLDEWRSVTGDDHEPQDPARRHDLMDAIAIPGGSSPVSALGTDAWAAGALVVRGDDLRLGSATASDFVALASLVLAELNALRAELILHTHTVAGITPGGGSVASLPAIGIGAASGSVAAAKVKAE